MHFFSVQKPYLDMFYPGMITQRKWDIFNWRCAITYSNLLQVILAPNFLLLVAEVVGAASGYN